MLLPLVRLHSLLFWLQSKLQDSSLDILGGLRLQTLIPFGRFRVGNGRWVQFSVSSTIIRYYLYPLPPFVLPVCCGLKVHWNTIPMISHLLCECWCLFCFELFRLWSGTWTPFLIRQQSSASACMHFHLCSSSVLRIEITLDCYSFDTSLAMWMLIGRLWCFSRQYCKRKPFGCTGT